MKARLIQQKDRTFHAYIDNEVTYEGVKSGRLSFKDIHKSKITHCLIPASVFERLLELDKKNDSVVKEKNDVSING